MLPNVMINYLKRRDAFHLARKLLHGQHPKVGQEDLIYKSQITAIKATLPWTSKFTNHKIYFTLSNSLEQLNIIIQQQ